MGLLLCGRLHRRLHWRLPGNFGLILQFLQELHSNLFLILLEILADFKHLFIHCGGYRIALCETRLECLNLGVEQAEGPWVGDFQTGQCVWWQLLVGLSEFRPAMCVRAVFSEVALCSLLIILADLSFVIIVRNIQHFVLHFQGQLLY